MNEPTVQFWLVWNERGHAPTHKHFHPEEAKAEAERLARQNPGQKFHVLQMCGTCEFKAVNWTWISEMDIPF